MRQGQTWGYIYLLIGTTLWGVSSVVAKSLFLMGLAPLDLVLVRLTLATFALLLFLLLFDRKRLAISPRDLPYFLIFGGLGIGANQFTFYLTISNIQVGLGVLIQYLAMIWIALYAILFQREPVTKWMIFSLALALAGCYLAVGGYRVDLLRLNKVGILSGLLSSFIFAFYTLLGEKGLKRYDPWTLIFYAFAIGTLLYWIIGSPSRVISTAYSLNVWIAFLYIAIFSTLIPFGLFFKGIDRIRATRASITSTWEPVVAIFTAYFVLGEVLLPLQVLGGIGVILAVILLQVGREREAPAAALEVRQKAGGNTKAAL